MYRYILAVLASAAFVLGYASAATAAPTGEFLRSYPTCERATLTNPGHVTCQTTATHYRTGATRHPVLVEFDGSCHVSSWRVETRWTTKGEPFRATCWEGGRFVTYAI